MILILSIFTRFSPAAQAADPPVFYVAPSPPGSGTSGGSCFAPGFNTIQSAVSSLSVPPGSLIVVCPGTYIEQVNIGKSLSLLGSGPSSTTVKAPGFLLPDTAGQFSIVTISGAITVSISRFTISGPGPTSCGSLHYGIFVKGGATAFISGNSIVHIRDNEGGTISGCQNGAGIRVGRSFTSDVGTANIKGNSISDYQKTGIVVDGAGTQATVRGNTVTGVGPTPKIAQNGIQVGRGASATVTKNTVSGNECNHPTCGPDLDNQFSDGGILLFNDSPAPLTVTVKDNNIFGNDIGVLPFFVTGGIKVVGNSITDNRFGNVALFTVQNLLLSHNTISTTSNTAAAPPCTVGSFCIGHSYTLGIDVLESSTGNTIFENTVKVTADKFAVLLDMTASGNSVTCNSLSANHGATTGNAAVDDAGTGNTVKNNNGCGHAECPSDEGSDAKTAQHEELCEERGNDGEQGNDIAEQENEQAEQSQQNSDLSNKDLSNADFTGYDFSNSNLKGADLSGSILQGANLAGADLTCVSLAGADLSGANLAGAILDGADLTGANLQDVDLSSIITSIGFAGCT